MKKVEMNPYKLPDGEALKRSFFKETIFLGWSFSEKSNIFNLCKERSNDFENLLSALSPFIERSDGEYLEPAPIRARDCEIDLNFMAENFEFFIYQFSLTMEMILSLDIINPNLYFRSYSLETSNFSTCNHSF